MMVGEAESYCDKLRDHILLEELDEVLEIAEAMSLTGQRDCADTKKSKQEYPLGV